MLQPKCLLIVETTFKFDELFLSKTANCNKSRTFKKEINKLQQLWSRILFIFLKEKGIPRISQKHLTFLLKINKGACDERRIKDFRSKKHKRIYKLQLAITDHRTSIKNWHVITTLTALISGLLCKIFLYPMMFNC